jgi:PST family polysaccharide transporter
MSEKAKKTQAAEQYNNTSSYRSIFKATSLFGGVQVYQILIGIIKSKFIAVLLGPMGMGIQGLYQSTLDLVKSITALGLGSSAVRDISEANGSGDQQRLGNVAATVQRLVWLTGLLGLAVTLCLSPLLSRLTFGNDDYTWGFAILSSTLLINQLCAGQKVVLQGMRRLKDLAKASAIGSTIGLIVSVPLYYWIGVKGIVPTMVLISLTAMFLSWYYSRRITIQKERLTTKQAIENGRSMMKMGVAMSISSILVTLFAYVLRWFIRSNGGVDEVGLFTAGFVIVNSYVGMVFTAMSTDYYPRLAAVNRDNARCNEIINQQGEIAVLILAPIIISCIVLMPFLIRLIYTEKFLPANDFITFAVTGTMFKAASWVISFCFLAKAESKLFIVNETIANIYILTLNLLGYFIGGLTGLGISFAIGNLFYLIHVFIIAHNRYLFRFSSSFLTVYIVQLIFVAICLMLALLMRNNPWFYLPAFVLFSSCFIYSLRELETRMGLLRIVKDLMKGRNS